MVNGSFQSVEFSKATCKSQCCPEMPSHPETPEHAQMGATLQKRKTALRKDANACISITRSRYMEPQECHLVLTQLEARTLATQGLLFLMFFLGDGARCAF